MARDVEKRENLVRRNIAYMIYNKVPAWLSPSWMILETTEKIFLKWQDKLHRENGWY